MTYFDFIKQIGRPELDPIFNLPTMAEGIPVMPFGFKRSDTTKFYSLYLESFTCFQPIDSERMMTLINHVKENGWSYTLPLATQGLCLDKHIRSKADCTDPDFLYLNSPYCLAYESVEEYLSHIKSKHKTKIRKALSDEHRAELIKDIDLEGAIKLARLTIQVTHAKRGPDDFLHAVNQLLYGIYLAHSKQADLIKIYHGNMELGYCLFVHSTDNEGITFHVHQGFIDAFNTKDFGKIAVLLSLIELNKEFGKCYVDITAHLSPADTSYSEYKRLFAHIENWRPCLCIQEVPTFKPPIVYKGCKNESIIFKDF